MKVTIANADRLSTLHDDVTKIIKEECKAVLKLLREWQHIAIVKGEAPGGGAQTVNAESTFRKKVKWKEDGLVPLVRPLIGKNGSLYDEKSWKVSAGKKKASITGPRVLNLLGSKYKTIVNDFPERFKKLLEQRIAKRIAKL
jgi:hypothetical protein